VIPLDRAHLAARVRIYAHDRGGRLLLLEDVRLGEPGS
jgi:hypothetical protein